MTIVISGPINNLLFKRIVEQTNEPSDQPLHIIINSEGGDEGCGRAIAGYLKQLGKAREIRTLGFGDIYSSAVLVFAAGQKRYLSTFAQIMVHESSMEVDGNASHIKSTAKQMEADEKFWCELMQTCTGTDAKIWMKLHADESYLNPQEALALNLATELL